MPVFSLVPLAKISGGLTALSLIFTIGRTSRQITDIPKEALYLLLMVVLLFASAILSPVWRGGAVQTVFDFSKVLVAWVLTFLLVTTLKRLRRIIFLQSASVAAVSLVAIVKGHSVERLMDVIPGALYSNPNDMGFAIVLSIPYCLAFLLTARSIWRKATWGIAIMVMTTALILTASRGAFIVLVIAGAVLLWELGVKGKRPQLIITTVFLCMVLMFVAGKHLSTRFEGILEKGSSTEQDVAHSSYEQRWTVIIRAVQAIARYPILGVGAGDFIVYSGIWRDVHMAFLEIAVDGGIPVAILYVLFFARGFSNLRSLSRTPGLDKDTLLFVGAVKSSLVGFVVGAWFAPVAYQFFPYFAVCYTSVLWAMAKERKLYHVSVKKLPTGPLQYRMGAS